MSNSNNGSNGIQTLKSNTAITSDSLSAANPFVVCYALAWMAIRLDMDRATAFECMADTMESLGKDELLHLICSITILQSPAELSNSIVLHLSLISRLWRRSLQTILVTRRGAIHDKVVLSMFDNYRCDAFATYARSLPIWFHPRFCPVLNHPRSIMTSRTNLHLFEAVRPAVETLRPPNFTFLTSLHPSTSNMNWDHFDICNTATWYRMVYNPRTHQLFKVLLIPRPHRTDPRCRSPDQRTDLASAPSDLTVGIGNV